MFQLLREKADDQNLILEPTTVMSDFELAIIQAAELSFPTTTTKGCYFHFCQCLIRKLQTLGLQVAYRENHNVGRFIRQTAALAFVPEQFVRLTWIGIKAAAPHQVHGVDDFSRYFEVTWLAGNYCLSLWNVYESPGERTNNHIEGWHSKLKRVVGKSHPNVFEIVEVFKLEQAATEVSLCQLQSGALPPAQSRHTAEKNRRIAELRNLQGLSGHTNLAM